MNKKKAVKTLQKAIKVIMEMDQHPKIEMVNTWFLMKDLHSLLKIIGKIEYPVLEDKINKYLKKLKKETSIEDKNDVCSENNENYDGEPLYGSVQDAMNANLYLIPELGEYVCKYRRTMLFNPDIECFDCGLCVKNQGTDEAKREYEDIKDLPVEEREYLEFEDEDGWN
jgi:uncharacterized protein YqgV (UPF0045/DUF77 family)